MSSELFRLAIPALATIALLLAAWVLVRLWKARHALGGLHDELQTEAELRAQAEAVLAGRLARGEIDRATYERYVERLWDLAPSGAPPRPGASEASTPPRLGAAPADPSAGGSASPSDGSDRPRG